MEVNVTKLNFDKEVLKSSVPVLVDFWAEWCRPCKMLAPVMSELASDYEDKIKVCKVNLDESPELASRFQIASIPTVLYFENGKLRESLVGLRPREHFEEMLGLI